MIFRVDKNITKIKFIKNNEAKEFDMWQLVYEIKDRNGVYLIFEQVFECSPFNELEDGQTIFIEKEAYTSQDADIETVCYKYSNMSLMVKHKVNSSDEMMKVYYVFSNNSLLDDSYRVLKSIL